MSELKQSLLNRLTVAATIKRIEEVLETWEGPEE